LHLDDVKPEILGRVGKVLNFRIGMEAKQLGGLGQRNFLNMLEVLGEVAWFGNLVVEARF